MMQAIMETIFDVLYLTGVLWAGVTMYRRQRSPLTRLFGIAAIVLAGGDSFHLLPRVWALWNGGTAAFPAALGIGKLVTSVTMTAFYVLLYYVWRRRYEVQGQTHLTALVWALAAARVALCLLPQNQWLSADPPLLWGVLRNLPFAALGLLLIVLYAVEGKRHGEKTLRHMPLAMALSFAFYIPVVLWADQIPALGALMIPKTLAYVWIVWMGWKLQKENVQ